MGVTAQSNQALTPYHLVIKNQNSRNAVRRKRHIGVLMRLLTKEKIMVYHANLERMTRKELMEEIVEKEKIMVYHANLERITRKELIEEIVELEDALAGRRAISDRFKEQVEFLKNKIVDLQGVKS